MRLQPFEAGHIYGAEINRHEREYQWLLEPTRLVALNDTAAVSVFEGDTLLAIGGTFDLDDDTQTAWAMFTSAVMPRHFPSLHKKAERGIAALFRAGLLKLVIHVDPTFVQAMRWAKMLKFIPTGDTVEFQGRYLLVMYRTA